METLQIVILIIGALLFTVSFFIPDKKVNTKEIWDKEEWIFKELMEREIPDIRKKIDVATEDSIERAKENTQRQMERLTNEKMMAINEYSDTVMSDIHKNHEEAVFLYDMLNNKHAQVKNIIAELNQVMKQAKMAQTMPKNVMSNEENNESNVIAQEMGDVAHESEKNVEQDNFKLFAEVNANREWEATFEPMNAKELEVVVLPEEYQREESQHRNKEIVEDAFEQNAFESMFATEENNNNRILEMHKAGKSNVVIARELGLGVGEVKLVIDLFKGGR